MDKVIIAVLKALGSLGEQGVHWFLELIETKVITSSTEIDDEIFYMVLNAVKSYEPKNPQE